MGKQRFEDMPAPQQAGILCNDVRFQSFVGSLLIKDGATMNAAGCAEHIRRTCGVDSRADLKPGTEAHTKFQALRTEFDAWTGKIAAHR